MDFVGLSVEGYKPFKKREDPEVRPLTILIGKNSSGKSALARLPLLLGRALSDRAEAPLDLAFDDLDFAGSFRDLVHDRVPHASVGIGATFLEKDGKRIELWAKVQEIDEYKLQIVSEFVLKVSDGFKLQLTWREQDPKENERPYACSGACSGIAKASFKGLLPDRLQLPNDESGDVMLRFRNLREALQDPWRSIAHLGPFRQRPERSYRFPGQMPRGVGMITGSRAPEMLGADYKTKRGILREVADWFREYLGGWEIDIEESGDAFGVVLKRPGEQNDLKINLVDVGQGMSQVLPLVVQRKYDELVRPGSSLEIVEQPELHLHPAVHGAVADLYVSSVAKGSSRFIIETHSEIFCLRVRSRVAAGDLESKKVIIYCIEEDSAGQTCITPINVLPTGEVDYWPEGVFSEDFEEVRKIREGQRAKAGRQE